MNFTYRKHSRLQTVYTIVSLGIVLGALVLVIGINTYNQSNEIPANEETSWAGLHPQEYRDAVLASRQRQDPMFALFRDRRASEDLLSFFEAIVHSEATARLILKYAAEYGVSPSLATALCWEESRFNPFAVNNNKTSIDRGLFQLNSKSFPRLTEQDFFDPDKNVRLGISHLRWCLDIAGNEVSGLAMYNAGSNRVKANTTPQKTLDYVSRILSFRDGIDLLFESQVAGRWQIGADGSVRAALASPNPQTNTPLDTRSQLSRR